MLFKVTDGSDIDYLNLDSHTSSAPPSYLPVVDPGLKSTSKFSNKFLYQMQAHHPDHSTHTEVGVMNNFERVQNVNTGNNQGMFNLDNLMFRIFNCISTGVIIQQVINEGVCDKYNMLLTSMIFCSIVVDLAVQINLQTIEDNQLGIYIDHF